MLKTKEAGIYRSRTDITMVQQSKVIRSRDEWKDKAQPLADQDEVGVRGFHQDQR